VTVEEDDATLATGPHDSLGIITNNVAEYRDLPAALRRAEATASRR
jgi:hypothetical protein